MTLNFTNKALMTSLAQLAVLIAMLVHKLPVFARRAPQDTFRTKPICKIVFNPLSVSM